jgi:hypothetical protein
MPDPPSGWWTSLGGPGAEAARKLRAWADQAEQLGTSSGNKTLGQIGGLLAGLFGGTKPQAKKQWGMEGGEGGLAGLIEGLAGSPANASMTALGMLPLPGKPGAGTKPGIKAWHGSPHDFERFSMEKVGTGEGHQAYGHGLYFGGAPETGEFYQKALTHWAATPDHVRDRYYTPGSIVYGYGGLDRVLDYRPATESSNWRVVVQRVDKAGNPLERPRTHATEPHLHEVNAAFAERGEPLWHPGHLYEVSLATHPTKLLDWDAPLHQQPPDVIEALRSLGVQVDPHLNTARLAADLGVSAPSGPTGGQSYRGIGSRLPEPYFGRPVHTTPLPPESASRALQTKGVHGIQYLDQLSRTKGEGTRNYVMFDDNLITIVKKYGIALPLLDLARRRLVSQNQDQGKDQDKAQ